MQIRQATAEDAPAAAEVLRRSIRELCGADHRDDPEVLRHWLANKTPEQFRAWLAIPGRCLLLATAGGVPIAVGSADAAGRVLLNYVAPEARFQGVSKAMLGALEAWARQQGATRCTLDSTATARRFYRAAGYVEAGPPIRMFGTASYPMAKALDAPR